MNINLRNFDALKKPEREALFDRHIQRYVEYPEHLRDKAVMLSMKIISAPWRTLKYRLKEMHKEGKDPFELYKELDRDDWNTFVQNIESKGFQSKSQ